MKLGLQELCIPVGVRILYGISEINWGIAETSNIYSNESSRLATDGNHSHISFYIGAYSTNVYGIRRVEAQSPTILPLQVVGL